MKIYPYSSSSGSAKALAAALNIRVLHREGRKTHVTGSLLNWGCSTFYRGMTYEDEFLNHPNAVARTVNKLKTFKALEGHISIPPWTEDYHEAFEWLREEFIIVGRFKLNGHSGEGIKIITVEDITDGWELAPLYTKYIKKRQEYRLHVFRGKVFFTQRKARSKEVPDDKVNWKIRNHTNGFIFAHKEGVHCGPQAEQYAIDAVNILGLDFGAVDIIKGVDDKWYVLEVNCAPGLTGTTLEKYVEIFKELK